MSRDELQKAFDLSDRKSFRERCLAPALAAGLIEMALPDRPGSRLQRYRRTAAGPAAAGSPVCHDMKRKTKRMTTPKRAFRLDNHVPKWSVELARHCREAMRGFTDMSLVFLCRRWKNFATMAIDFAVDVARGAGFWRGYEAWNLRHFGVALPVTEGEPGDGLTPARIAHFVWRAPSVLDREITLPPDHPDLRTLTDVVGRFLRERLSALPGKVGPDAFFAAPQHEGVEVKRKLVALGTTAYFFREPYAAYMAEEAEDADGLDDGNDPTMRTDDFLSQACACWSGMGAVDLLAEVLDLPPARLDDLRGWRSRHLAAYRLDEVAPGAMRATNLFNDREYRIVCVDPPPAMKRGAVILGWLVPWDGAWLWSGGQTVLGHDREGERQGRALRDVLKRRSGDALCRSWPEYRDQAMELFASIRAASLTFRNNRDLAVYPDESALEADQDVFVRELRRIQEGRLKCGLPPARTRDDFKDAFARKATSFKGAEASGDATASFFNPDEGEEVLFGYHDLRAALDKRGEDLTSEERDVLREFVQSPSLSPAFVRRVLQDHPPDALFREFGIPPESPPTYALDWMLRCWKGEFYRTRYPAVSVV